MGPIRLSEPTPGALKIAPSPLALFQAPVFQLRLDVSHWELAEPLVQVTSAARAACDASMDVIASTSAEPTVKPLISVSFFDMFLSLSKWTIRRQKTRPRMHGNRWSVSLQASPEKYL